MTSAGWHCSAFVLPFRAVVLLVPPDTICEISSKSPGSTSRWMLGGGVAVLLGGARVRTRALGDP